MASHFQLRFSKGVHSPSTLDAYVGLVVLAGLLVCGSLLGDAITVIRHANLTFWVLAACVLPAEILRVTTWHRGTVNQLTMSRPFALVLLTGWGAAPTVVVFVIASVVSDLVYRKPPIRILFNAGQYALTMAAAAVAYSVLGGRPSLGLAQVPAFIAAAVVMLLVNRLLVRVAVALHQHRSMTIGYLLAEAQVELVEGAVQFSMVLVALLVAEHRLVLPAVLALPAVPIFVAGRAAERAENASRQYAEQLLRYRHLFVVADRFRRQADAGGGVNSMQLSAVALDLRASTSMLQGLLKTISREAERRDLNWLQALAGNGVEHSTLLSGKLEQLQQAGAPLRSTSVSVRQRIDAVELLRVAEQLATTVCQGRPVLTDIPAERLPVYVNQDEVLDVLGNLVLNAHRFAPPTTPICLAVTHKDADVVLSVEDEGVDFTPEQREHIFDEELERDGARGLSHGVAMARQLAHANGGELRAVEPQRAGGRSRFELSLPLSPEAPVGAVAPHRLAGQDAEASARTA
ncbi:MAG TPA: ATP-binding protein [Actinomycetes bacterium]|nr:ATP-binding protein [Actinomycetes bacterium]